MIKLDTANLYKVCRPADFGNSLANLRLAQSLFQLMIKEKGIGLAANQAGHDIRLFVMYVDREAFHCFNPEILEYSDEKVSFKEGCLSFPDQNCTILRPKQVLARFANANGQVQDRWFDGIAARCYQHELDHLDGITMHNRTQETVEN